MVPAALLSLFLVDAGAQQPPPATLCDVKIEIRDPKKMFALAASDDPLCARMKAFRVPFDKLREAAGFRPDELRFATKMVFIDYDPPNAWYWRGTVNVNHAFLERFAADDPAAIYTFAHEIGHAVQDREGLITANMPRDRSRRIEAQADVTAADLLKRAGYTFAPETGEERFFGCASIKTDLESGGTHPADGRRWLNSLRVKEVDTKRVDASIKQAASAKSIDPATASAFFDGSGKGSAGTAPEPRALYKPPYSLDAFDSQGRLIAAKPVLDRRLVQPPTTIRDLAITAPPSPKDLTGVLPPMRASRIEGWSYDVARKVLVPRYSLALPVGMNEEGAAAAALRSCGSSAGVDYGQAVRLGLDEMSLETARWMSGGLRSKSSRGPGYSGPKISPPVLLEGPPPSNKTAP